MPKEQKVLGSVPGSQRIKRGRECVNSKLDQHMLTFLGRYTLEGQKGQHCLVRGNKPPWTFSLPLVFSEREGGKEEEEEADTGQRAKGARESQGACTQAMAPSPTALASGVCMACSQDITPNVKVLR